MALLELYEVNVAERSTGLRKVLTLAPVYSAFQSAVGDTKYRTILTDRFIRPTASDRILDMGCGPASMLEYLEPATYVGFDPSPNYIESARSRYGDRGTFHVGDASSLDAATLGAPFTIVLAVGVLHHIGDAAAAETIRAAMDMLSPGGRLVTVDCCLDEAQHPVARWLIERDRGENVRTKDEMARLYSSVTTDAEITVRNDMLRVPYTHIIVETTKASS